MVLKEAYQFTHNNSRKLDELEKSLIMLKRVLVLFSGGVDSSFLLFFARRVLGKANVLALTGDSPSLPREELLHAENFCILHDINLQTLHTNELENQDYIKNSFDRCYHCKIELQFSVTSFMKSHPIYAHWKILDGLQSDDDISQRPGYKATSEYGVLHPMYELKISKSEIREFCKYFNLELHDKPESACLSSRIMKGTKVTKELLAIVEKAESILHAYSLKDARARLHELPNKELLIRIETKNLKHAFEQILNSELTSQLLKIGADYVTFDLEGYKQGGFSNKKLQIV